MATMTGEQLQRQTGRLRAEARRAPVEITYHGRAELMVMSVEDYAILRVNRKLVMRTADMDASELERIAGNRMAAEHAALNSLLDD